MNMTHEMIISLMMIFILNTSCDHSSSSSIKSIHDTPTKVLPKKSKEVEVKPRVIKVNDKLKYKTGVGVIFEDSKGDFWFGSHQEGVCFYDGNSFKYFTVEDGLNDNQIRSIHEDENGEIWFGTAYGVNSYDGEKIINRTPNNILAQDIPFPSKWEKTDDDLWFNASHKAGVLRYDGKKVRYLSFPVPEGSDYFNPHGVTGFSKGKDGKIWIATYSAVFGYNGQSMEVIDNEKLGFTEEFDLLHVRSILEDSKGNLWIGNNGIGVLLDDGDSISNFSKDQGVFFGDSARKGLPSKPGTLEHVFAIAEDRKGNIWFGDRDTGAWKYDGVAMTNYNKADGLTSDFVQTIYKDKTGGLWFGLDNGDVFKFKGRSFKKMF